MHIDPQATRAMARTARRRSRGPWMSLLSAVLGLAGGRAELLRHGERAWASATFSGSRHTIALVFQGHDAMADGEAFIDALPDHEFAISGHVVADAVIVAAEQDMGGTPTLTVEAELLLLEDC